MLAKPAPTKKAPVPAPNALLVKNRIRQPKIARDHAAHQQASVAHARQDRHRDQAAGEQEEPVEREDHQRTGRAQSDAADQEDAAASRRSTTRCRTGKQQQCEQHGAGAAEILRVPGAAWDACRGPARRSDFGHKTPAKKPGTTAMKIRMLGTRVDVEGASDQQRSGEAAEAVPDAAGLTVPAASAW